MEKKGVQNHTSGIPWKMAVHCEPQSMIVSPYPLSQHEMARTATWPPREDLGNDLGNEYLNKHFPQNLKLFLYL